MRKYIFWLVTTPIFTLLTSGIAQNPFEGIWEFVDGINAFQVILYDDPDYNDDIHLLGDYRLIERSNGVETLIYKSNYELTPPHNQFLADVGWQIFGRSYSNQSKFSGQVTDNTIDYQLGIDNRKAIIGNLFLELLSIDITCPNCPQRISWKIEKPRGLYIGTADDYNIPTDIVLTKVD